MSITSPHSADLITAVLGPDLPTATLLVGVLDKVGTYCHNGSVVVQTAVGQASIEKSSATVGDDTFPVTSRRYLVPPARTVADTADVVLAAPPPRPPAAPTVRR